LLRAGRGAAYTVGVMTSTERERETRDVNATEQVEQGRVVSTVAWTSLGFAALQSLCTVMFGLSGGRLVIALLSAATASSFFTGVRFWHQDALRIPMVVFAVLGGVVNLILVAQVRRLRNRPSARWRLDMAALAGTVRRERWLIWTSVVTLGLVAVEEALHVYQHGHL